MPMLELVHAGDVRKDDKVREKGEDDAAWVIAHIVETKGDNVTIEARYEGEDHVFLWGVYGVDDELEVER